LKWKKTQTVFNKETLLLKEQIESFINIQLTLKLLSI